MVVAPAQKPVYIWAMTTSIPLNIQNEYAALSHVIMGTAEGYHRDASQVAVVNSTQEKTVAASGHPTEAQITPEFAAFRAAMEAAGVTVHQPVLAPPSVQDQTCPRDIGFVIGDLFVAAGMRHPSRTQEIEAIAHIMEACGGRRTSVPPGIALEGGDVVVDAPYVFVGVGQRSDPEGPAFLAEALGGAYEVVPLPCRSLADGEEVLHLDCTFNPLGLGHALIYPQGLSEIPSLLAERYQFIEIDRQEAEALATNVFSVAPDHIIARAGQPCARVNAALRAAGYRVSEVAFDGVPSSGGSFRCATLPLCRAG